MTTPVLVRRRFLGTLARTAAGITLAPAAARGAGVADVADAFALRRPPAREEDWERVKALFPLRDGIVPLNAANLCPAPRTVIDAVAQAMRDVDGDVSFQNRAKYDTIREEVRSRLAAYLGASADEIALVRNTSEANNIIVNGLPLEAGDEVLLLDQNHPTNNVAWDVRAARDGLTVRRVSIDGVPSSPEQVLDVFRRAVGPRTRVLTFSDVSNTTGLRLPTEALCELARSRGIHCHVDGAQTFGALVRDLHALGCDSYAASGHKWFMGPKETGILFVRAERIPDIWPSVVGVGWGDGPVTSAQGARKFETLGQRNDATIAAWREAIRLHELIGPRNVEARVLELGSAFHEGFARLPGASLVTPANQALRAGVVITRFDGADMRAIYQRLYAEYGIAAAATGGLRVSPHVYVTMADVERTLDAVGRLVRG